MAITLDSAPKRLVGEPRNYTEAMAAGFLEHGLTGLTTPITPWHAKSIRPTNAITGKPYLGANAIALMTRAAAISDIHDGRWVSAAQGQQRGWILKPGERPTIVEYIQTTGRGVGGQTVPLEKPRVLHAQVFHASQWQNIPDAKRVLPDAKRTIIGEQIIQASGVTFHHQVPRTDGFYSGRTDAIHMPGRDAYRSAGEFQGVAIRSIAAREAHIIGGHGGNGLIRGSIEHGATELRSHMAALLITGESGVPFQPSSDRTIHDAMARALGHDRHEFFKAADDAQTIVHTMTRARGIEIDRGQQPAMLGLIQLQTPAIEAMLAF
jgi:putative DNA primase/helicase